MGYGPQERPDVTSRKSGRLREGISPQKLQASRRGHGLREGWGPQASRGHGARKRRDAERKGNQNGGIPTTQHPRPQASRGQPCRHKLITTPDGRGNPPPGDQRTMSVHTPDGTRETKNNQKTTAAGRPKTTKKQPSNGVRTPMLKVQRGTCVLRRRVGSRSASLTHLPPSGFFVLKKHRTLATFLFGFCWPLFLPSCTDSGP